MQYLMQLSKIQTVNGRAGMLSNRAEVYSSIMTREVQGAITAKLNGRR